MFNSKKSLGQNFLKSAQALRQIIEAAELSTNDTVLEIGPGKGVLTEQLLAYSGNVIAVEKDARLISFLQEKFHSEISSGKLQLIHADILNFDPTTYYDLRSTYCVVANIPYYITGAIIKKFLIAKHQPSRMVLLLQKEVGKRIVAGDARESLLSLSVKAYGTPRYIATVSKRYFSPVPKVDSAIIAIENISREFFTGVSETNFFDLLHVGFGSKRKQLAGNLTKSTKGGSPNQRFRAKKWPKEKVLRAFVGAKIPPKARAENLTIADWKELYLLLSD